MTIALTAWLVNITILYVSFGDIIKGMNERISYYLKQLKTLGLYFQNMPDLGLRTALILGGIFISLSMFLMGATYARNIDAREAVAVTGALPFIEYPKVPEVKVAGEALADGAYVAGKTGSVYYSKLCKGWSRIGKNNRVWFNTKEEAEAAGYARAKNCKI